MSLYLHNRLHTVHHQCDSMYRSIFSHLANSVWFSHHGFLNTGKPQCARRLMTEWLYIFIHNLSGAQ